MWSLFVLFIETASPCSLGDPEIQSVDQAGPELIDLPASASLSPCAGIKGVQPPL